MRRAAIPAVLGAGLVFSGYLSLTAYTDSVREKEVNEVIKYLELGADPNGLYSGYNVEELGAGYTPADKFMGKTLIGDFPVVSQFPELPTGCEITCAAAFLRFLGFDADKVNLSDMYMKQNNNFYRSEDVLYGPDPEKTFAGDPKDFGYGCFEKVIADAMNSYFAANNASSEYEAVTLPGLNDADIERLLDEGVPIIVWASKEMNVYRYSEQSKWKVIDSEKEIVWRGNSHTLVLVGYDLNAYYFMDCGENAGIIPYARESFIERFTENGSRACTVKIKEKK